MSASTPGAWRKQHHECIQDGHVSKPSSFQIDFGPGDSEDCFCKIWWWGKIASFYHGCYLNISPFKKGNTEHRLTSIYRQRIWGYPCYWMLLKHHETSLGTATEMHRVSPRMLEQLMVKSNSLQGFPLHLDCEKHKKQKISSTMSSAMKTQVGRLQWSVAKQVNTYTLDLRRCNWKPWLVTIASWEVDPNFAVVHIKFIALFSLDSP